VHNDTPMFRP